MVDLDNNSFTISKHSSKTCRLWVSLEAASKFNFKWPIGEGRKVLRLVGRIFLTWNFFHPWVILMVSWMFLTWKFQTSWVGFFWPWKTQPFLSFKTSHIKVLGNMSQTLRMTRFLKVSLSQTFSIWLGFPLTWFLLWKIYAHSPIGGHHMTRFQEVIHGFLPPFS